MEECNCTNEQYPCNYCIEKYKSYIWTCCGGIELHEDEKCPICGEEYQMLVVIDFIIMTGIEAGIIVCVGCLIKLWRSY